MNKGKLQVHVGLRTIKTAASVLIAMVLVDAYGVSTSKLIFAMLGAMAAVQPTFQESVESCLAQIVGVLFGAVVSILLLYLPMPPLVVVGTGIILVITLYNALCIRFAPGIPCLIVVILCTTDHIRPLAYVLDRIWDTAIGLMVGMAINMLVFPYDNSRRIRATAESLDREVLGFLEELFDGDTVIPDALNMSDKIDDMDKQLKIFSKQKLPTKLQRQHRELETFRLCEKRGRELIARMEILSQMQNPGRLDAENRRHLKDCGVLIGNLDLPDRATELDVVTNYHVRQILLLRRELLEALDNSKPPT